MRPRRHQNVGRLLVDLLVDLVVMAIDGAG
jgi:hypothetical protein